MTRLVAVIAVVALGCEEIEAPPLIEASTDSGARRDAGGVEPASDAGPGTPDAGPPDAGPVVVRDGGSDAGCACPVLPECMTGACVDEVCVSMPSPDGSACEDMGEGVCMLGVCVVSGCGDGTREGTELCDDGNELDGDACSSTCAPTVAIVRHIDGPDYRVASEGGHRVASDLLSRLLFVWVEQHIEGDARLMGQRANSGGALEGDVIEIAPSIGGLQGAVSGIGGSEGWVTAWDTPTGVDFRIVAPDGTLGPTRTASDVFPGATSYGEPMLAELTTGFVLVWTAFSSPGARSPADVLARVFDETARPLGTEITVPTETRDFQDHPSVAASGDRWMVAWVDHRILLGSIDRVFARRFEGTGAVGGQFEVLSGEAGPPAVASAGGDAFALASVSEADIFYRVIDPGETVSMDDVEELTMTPGGERHLSAANFGGTDVFVIYNMAGTAGFALPTGTTIPTVVMDVLPRRLRIGDGQAAVSPVRGGAWVTWAESGRRNFATMFVPSRTP